MFAKIGIILSIIATIVYYSTGYNFLFWLSIADGLIIFISSYAISYIIARPIIKENKKIIQEMKQRGNTSEEIGESIDSNKKIGELSNKRIPTFIAIINFIAIIIAFFLLIIGIFNR